MHRLIREDEKTEAFSAFVGQHRTHLSSIDVSTGSWSLVMHCPLCNDWEGFQIDNKARRKALTHGAIIEGRLAAMEASQA